MTPFKFIEQMRLKFAHQQLIQKPQNIQQLSEQCGYKDYETFSRAFKKSYCLSPHDLAAITEKIRQAHESHDGIFVAAMTEFDLKSIQKKFNELINELQLSNQQVNESSVFTVDKVINSDEIDLSNQLVKNKFRVAKDEKLWQLLIDSR